MKPNETYMREGPKKMPTEHRWRNVNTDGTNNKININLNISAEKL